MDEAVQQVTSHAVGGWGDLGEDLDVDDVMQGEQESTIAELGS